MNFWIFSIKIVFFLNRSWWFVRNIYQIMNENLLRNKIVLWLKISYNYNVEYSLFAIHNYCRSMSPWKGSFYSALVAICSHCVLVASCSMIMTFPAVFFPPLSPRLFLVPARSINFPLTGWDFVIKCWRR